MTRSHEFTVQEIPPQAVRLWRLMGEILEQEGAEGGRQGEFRDASVKLHMLLGLKPWEEHAIDAGSPEPPGWMKDERRRADYRRAHRLFLVMEAAAKATRARKRTGHEGEHRHEH